MAKLNENDIARILSAPQAKAEIQTDISYDELSTFGDRESVKGMFESMAAYNKMLKERITFINPSLTAAIPFTRENLYLICAFTGSGKTTIGANISYSLWQDKKKTLVLSNEESAQDIMGRIACIHLGLNFNDYKKGLMEVDDQKRVAVLFPEIAEYVNAKLDVNFGNGTTSTLEGIKNALTTVQDKDYSCAMIDYFQLISKSVQNPHMSNFDVLDDLRQWLGRYIKKSNIPVVLFAQLHSHAKRSGDELDNKIKDLPKIMEPATVILEAIPNFESQTTDMIIKKDRFGLQGRKITMGFDHGRLIDYDDEFRNKNLSDRLDALQGKVNVEKV